jgi:hypothetical protein
LRWVKTSNSIPLAIAYNEKLHGMAQEVRFAQLLIPLRLCAFA